MRKLKNLEQSITVSVVDPLMTDEEGWKFSDYPCCTQDSVCNTQFLYEIYQKESPKITCRVTVPVLYDKKTQKIVNTESPEIMIMLNNCFDGPDYYPEPYREKIEEINAWVHDKIGDWVYKCGSLQAKLHMKKLLMNFLKYLIELKKL